MQKDTILITGASLAVVGVPTNDLISSDNGKEGDILKEMSSALLYNNKP